MTFDVSHFGALTSEVGATVWRYGRWTVMELPGALDWVTAPAARTTLFEILDGGVRSVLVDMSKVTGMDAVGIGVLLSAYHRIGSDFRIVSPPEPILATLKATGISRLVPIYDSMQAARADLGAQEQDG